MVFYCEGLCFRRGGGKNETKIGGRKLEDVTKNVIKLQIAKPRWLCLGRQLGRLGRGEFNFIMLK